MARTWHHRPAQIQRQTKPWLKQGVGERGRTRHQKAAHRLDRAAVRMALRTDSEPPRTQRRRVDRDTH